MLADAAELVASRQVSKKTPRTYSDYREMLEAARPRHRAHRHARSLARAADDRGGQVRRWTSGSRSRSASTSSKAQAMLAAARKYKRVVQVGMQRRSTPHLVDARDRVIREGRLGTIGLVEIYCYYHMRATREPARLGAARESRLRDVDRPGADAPLQLARAPAQLARVHGVRQRHRRRHVRAHARHGALDDGPRHARAHQLVGRHPGRQGEQGEHHRHADRDVRFRQPAGGLDPPLATATPPDPKYPWGATFYGDKGTLKASVMGYDFVPRGKDGQPIHEDVTYEFEQFPEDRTEKDLERHVAPAIRAHMKDFLGCIESRQTPVADIEQGYMSATACILANLSMQLGRSLQWDHAKGVVVGDAEANRLLRRPYRAPWVHPEVTTV